MTQKSRKPFRIAATTFFTGLLLTLLLIFFAPRIDTFQPTQNVASLTSKFHAAVRGEIWTAHLLCFNDTRHGPYTGSILTLGPSPENPTVRGFGSSGAHYFRHITWPNGQVIWTLSVSLWYPGAFFLASLIIATSWQRRSHRKTRNTDD